MASAGSAKPVDASGSIAAACIVRRLHCAAPAASGETSCRPRPSFSTSTAPWSTRAPDLVETLNVILGREGLPAIAYDDARKLVGWGARRMIERGLEAKAGSGGQPTCSACSTISSPIMPTMSRIARGRFPASSRRSDTLAARGCRFAVCTNKLEWLSVRLLEALGLADRFVAICGQDTFAVQKPDPDALHGTLRRAGGTIGRAVMVGDSETDIATAQAAGMPVIAVDFGYTAVPVTELGPDRIISHFNALPDSIVELLALRDAPLAAAAGIPARPENCEIPTSGAA